MVLPAESNGSTTVSCVLVPCSSCSDDNAHDDFFYHHFSFFCNHNHNQHHLTAVGSNSRPLADNLTPALLFQHQDPSMFRLQRSKVSKHFSLKVAPSNRVLCLFVLEEVTTQKLVSFLRRSYQNASETPRTQTATFSKPMAVTF